jgi:BMFP domain-containing protein YqiC
VYLVINGVRYWVLLSPSGLMLYQREGLKTKYLGRQPLEEVRRLLAQAGADALQRIKSDVEAVRQALEGQRPAQTAQTPSLTWKKDGHTYWLLVYAKSVYIYMKGPTTRHKPRLIEKSDISGVIGRVLAAGAVHVLEALKALVNGLHAAVSDLLKPQRSAAGEAQAPRREAEDAFRELRKELSRAVKRWDEEWRMKARDWGGPDRKWLRERLWEFIDDNMHLVEKILPHQDLKNKFADAVEEAAAGHLTRSDVLDVLEVLKER